MGFIGLLFVILISSLATVMVVMVISSARSTTQEVLTEKKADILIASIQRYFADRGAAAYPVDLNTLVTTDGTPCAADNTPASPTYLALEGWCGPYIDIQFAEASNDYQIDGWGTGFTYDNTTGSVTTCGPDRICGNADDVTYTP